MKNYIFIGVNAALVFVITLSQLFAEQQQGADDITRQGDTFVVEDIEFVGEVEFWHSLSATSAGHDTLAEEFKEELIGREVTRREIVELCERYTDEELIKEQSYILAYLRPRMRPLEEFQEDGKVTVEVHTGKYGDVLLYQVSDQEEEEKENDKQEFEGRYYSRNQILRKVDFETGRPFNYNRFYDRMFFINTLPDITMDGELVIRQDEETRDRFVDMELEVEESLPLHGTVGIDNTGTEVTDEWRTTATLQYLNLTKNFDVLSLDTAYSLDGSLYSGAGSYYLPFDFLNTSMGVTAFGGYSKQEVEEIVTDIDIESEGWFYGLELRADILEFSRYEFSTSLEVVTRYTENQILFRGLAFPTELTIAPITAGLDYSETEEDRLGGRNFISYSFSINRGGFLGSDGDDEFAAARVEAEADYTLHRLQAARIQRLFGGKGNWLLYLRGSGQYTDDPLVPSEQLAMGGMNTVRGYNEREVIGDLGYLATVELRTPLINRTLFGVEPKMDFQGEEIRPWETLQLVSFADYGYLERLEAQPGEFSDLSLFGAGAGLRFSAGEFMQLRIDYGFALEDLEDDTGVPTDDGRLHFSIQGQF